MFVGSILKGIGFASTVRKKKESGEITGVETSANGAWL
jgi:hypothetical protein